VSKSASTIRTRQGLRGRTTYLAFGTRSPSREAYHRRNGQSLRSTP